MKHQYQILARRYRPQTFASIVGQEGIVTTLKNALRFKRLAHAYLFCGSRGTGKTTIARLFAKAINCRHRLADEEPCNQCPSCLEISSGSSLDVLEIDGASNRGIDDIRQINETVGYASTSGGYKIYIIDEVHMLTKEAFNALLKTLEEPPANVKFFFATTEPHKVLPTIISRCQRFDLNRLALNAILQKLTEIASDLKVDVEETALHLIAKKAEGSLRDAESLLDQMLCYAEGPISLTLVTQALGLTSKERLFELDKAIQKSYLPFAFSLASELFSAGKEIAPFLEDLIEHFRIHLLLKLTKDEDLQLLEQEKKNYRETSSGYTEEQCLYILDFLIEQEQLVSKIPFKRIGLEMILLHLIRSAQRVPIDLIAKRLLDLEQSIHFEPLQLPSSKLESHVPDLKNEIIEVKLDKAITDEASKKVETSQIEEKPIPATIVSSASSESILVNHPLTPSMSKSKYETLIRFAAVELEGVVKFNKG